ncbi:putative secretory pathway GDP dissociation inhibitor 1 [Cucumispora dikerogammari]|nr:putative secretory pathway GDP dissociation inhibitor 1 [Cucumispora dikerogammari]
MESTSPEEFDFVIFGTGIIESLIGAKLSKTHKILFIDKNGTYGSDTTSLNYKEICEKFQQAPQPALLNNYRLFSIDILPKMILIEGKIQDYLTEFHLKEMINFVIIPGCFIYKKGKCISIPMDEKTSFDTTAVSFWQKPRLMKFFWDVRKYVESPEKYKFQKTMREEFELYGINDETKELIGHALCQNLDDSYLNNPPKETFDKIVLFVGSIRSQKSCVSPFAYPLYGLSEFSQTFVRYACNRGSVCRLNTTMVGINISSSDDIYSNISTDGGRKAETNIEKNNEGGFIVNLIDHENKPLFVKARNILADPTYLPEDTQLKYEIIRCICIIRGKTAFLEENISAQITFLASDLKRKNDIFLLILGEREKTTIDGYKIAIISTIKETTVPEDEISFVISKLGNLIHKFLRVDEVRGPFSEFKSRGIYISQSIDHTPSLESVFVYAEGILKDMENDGVLRDI